MDLPWRPHAWEAWAVSSLCHYGPVGSSGLGTGYEGTVPGGAGCGFMELGLGQEPPHSPLLPVSPGTGWHRGWAGRGDLGPIWPGQGALRVLAVA